MLRRYPALAGAALLGALAVLALSGCAHTESKAAQAPVPAALPAKPAAPPQEVAQTPAPAPSSQTPEPTPAACLLTPNEIGQLHQFAKTRHYLRQQAFPQWEATWPHFFVYGERCQYIMNFADIPGDGFRLSSQKMEFGGFVSSQVYYRENAVALPTGGKLPFFIPAQAFSTGDRANGWFVMGLYDVWRRDYGDSLQSYLGMLSREMFRSYQQRIPGMRPLGDAAAREAFARFCRQNPEFAQMVDEERSFLMRAITETDAAKKRDWTKQYLEIESKRRARFFVAERAGWRREEPWLEAVDGSAEYMNFRVLADCPDIPKDARLVDPAGKAFATCGKVALGELLRKVAFRPSYLQDIGVLQVILLNQVTPHWQDSLFRGETAVESLLGAYAGVEPRVTR